MADKQQYTRPRLLAPAGSFDALSAALCGGADEIYFGAGNYHARQGAKNFSDDELREALRLCKIFGVKSNLTVNTVLFDRELSDALNFVEHAANLGADCFIVQDMGLLSALRREMPSLELHASTQCACHNREGAQELFDAGFSRIVLARELSAENIRKIAHDAPYETEIFAHGALCVCHSGQCLFSSVVGGRSGNRGLCAQPCRMEYDLAGASGKSRHGYPLSLKDLCLASAMKDVFSLGVSVLKLEGRMKSPAYVYGVTKLYKTLLTEERGATEDELCFLYDLFSRSGFTDGYFTGKVLSDNRAMYGVRSERDKEKSVRAEKDIVIPPPKKEIGAAYRFYAGEKPRLSLVSCETAVEVCGNDVLSAAEKAPATEESVAKNLIKTGGTPFLLRRENIAASLGENCFVPSGLLNELRREACEKLASALSDTRRIAREKSTPPYRRREESENAPSVRLYFASCDNFEEKLRPYRDIESVVFPLSAFRTMGESLARISEKITVGILFPRVVMPDEVEAALGELSAAKTCGASFCEVSNIGHIALARRAGLLPFGGVGLNITNSESAAFYEGLGLSSLVLSPECKLAAVRDIRKSAGIKYCFYARGRLPLMTLESCVFRAGGKCEKKGDGEICGTLCDRLGYTFPVMAQKRRNAEYPCRNILYNAVLSDLRTKKELYTAGLSVLCLSAEENGMPL